MKYMVWRIGEDATKPRTTRCPGALIVSSQSGHIHHSVGLMHQFKAVGILGCRRQVNEPWRGDSAMWREASGSTCPYHELKARKLYNSFYDIAWLRAFLLSIVQMYGLWSHCCVQITMRLDFPPITHLHKCRPSTATLFQRGAAMAAHCLSMDLSWPRLLQEATFQTVALEHLILHPGSPFQSHVTTKTEVRPKYTIDLSPEPKWSPFPH